MRKEDGRLQAYGWSLPAKVPPTPIPESGNRSQVPVPVPVYCQPLAANDPTIKVAINFFLERFFIIFLKSLKICRSGALRALI